MTSAMTTERFAGLAEAFGGQIDRWPAAEQAAARTYWGAYTDEAAEILAAASALDDLLAQSPEPVFSGVMRESILNRAAPKRASWRSPVRWASGMGLAAACAAGILVGVSLSGQIIGDPALDVLDQASTSFDAVYTLDTENAG